MPNPYVKDKITCAVCGAVRQETNHWFVQVIDRGDRHGLPMYIQVLVTAPFLRELLNHPQARPICGESCAAKNQQAFLEILKTL